MRTRSQTMSGRRRFALMLPALALLLGACASFPEQEARPARRIGEAVTLPAPTPAEPKLSAEELLAMAKRGAKNEAIIARFEASGARIDLTPTQVVDLHARGLPLSVLEAIHTGRERALHNDPTYLAAQANLEANRARSSQAYARHPPRHQRRARQQHAAVL